jgi:hypothetical protein
MPSSNTRKLRIGEDERLFLINAPPDFGKKLGPLPRGAKIISKPVGATQLHWFVTTAGQVAKELPRVLELLRERVLLWTYYPKGTSGVQTDLSRDTGWDDFTSVPNLQWLSLISFDDTWSAFGSRVKTDADRKRESNSKIREILNWIDPGRKIVRLPDDFAAALEANPGQRAFFNTLSFTNRKEYVEWIVTAKRAETRAERLRSSVERLGKNWKNPRNM